MSNLEQWDAILEMQREIERAARHLELEWPEVVDSWEDLASDIQVKLVEENQAVNLLAYEPKPRKKALFRIAQRIASQMRDDYEYFSGNYLYSTDEVRKVLEKGALAGVFQHEVKDGSVLEPAVATTVEHQDVAASYAELEPHHRQILLRRYGLGDVLDNAERMTVTRAVDALTATLNRNRRRDVAEYEGPGSRQAISNTRAINTLGTQEGD